MLYKICVVSGSRSDYGLLRELLFRMNANKAIDLDFVVTGAHLSEEYGNTQQEILDDGFAFLPIQLPLEDDSKNGIANATGKALCMFSDHYSVSKPELVVVLGDRYEVFAAVIAARMNGIPVAHISGGDVTEGALDDCIRHSITKMSQLHFAGCEQSRRRIIQMGEQPDLVYNVGEPGVENCIKMNFYSPKELSNMMDFDFLKTDYAVVTFHPVTLDNDSGIGELYELINALDSVGFLNYIITMANADAGGKSINEIWKEESKKHDNWFIVSSLGVKKYLSVVSYAKVVIGNSSSGIVEAPSIGIPTVNVGDRQKGRMVAESVINCKSKKIDIENAIKLALSDEYQNKAKHVTSPFGDGTTSERIEHIIIDYLQKRNNTSCVKRFFDIDY